MKPFQPLIAIASVAILIMMSACTLTVKSHEPTERKLAGTWEVTTTEIEDGITITLTMRDTYSLTDHRFESKVIMKAGYPLNKRLMTMTYSGQWRASRDMLITHIDKNSIDFTYNSSLLDRSDILRMKQEMTYELKKNDYREGIELKSDITDRFTAEDEDGDTYTFFRVD